LTHTLNAPADFVYVCFLVHFHRWEYFIRTSERAETDSEGDPERKCA